MVYIFGDYELDDERYELRCAGKSMAVEPKAFAMLAYLLQHRDRVVAKQELLAQLWPETFVSEAALTRCLARARQAVGDDGMRQHVIKTVWGHGYRFVTPVEIGAVAAIPPTRLSAPQTDDLASAPPPAITGSLKHSCPGCQAINTVDRMFCWTCGFRLLSTCPQCGFRNAPEAHFCGGCGAVLETVPTDLAILKGMTLTPPMRLTAQILASREALAGERKTVTALVVGLKGLTALAANVDPEIQHRLLNGAVQLMLQVIHGVEGFVAQFTENGLVALFGAPLAAEDHVLRALHAALSMQQVCAAYLTDVHQRQAITLDFGIGLHCGAVRVGTIGDDMCMAYTAQGFTLTLAHRLQEQAQQGAVYVSDAVRQQAGGLFQFDALGTAAFPELPQPIRLYACTGKGPLTSRLEGFLHRRTSRFVGREAAMEQLQTLWTHVQRGEGHVVLLFGEAGVGKSRLAYEFRRTLAQCQVLEAQALSYSRQAPYHALIPVLHRVLAINPGDPVSHQQHQLHERLAAMSPSVADEAPFLAQMLGVPWTPSPESHLTQDEQKRRLQHVCVQVLLQQTAHAPVCFVVEDLHWLDDSTLELLEMLIAALALRPILLLGTARPGFRPPWADYTYFHRLTMTPLSTDQTTTLVRDFCHPHEVSNTLATYVQDRTGGNPFFVEEIMHALLEQKQLIVNNNMYHLAAGPAVTLPASVQAVVAARIDRLPTASKRLLQIAAVIGAEIPLWLLKTIANVSQEELSRRLTHLQKTEFLYETHVTPERAYTFKHVLTQEVAYESLVLERRRALHACVLQALETQVKGQVAVPVEQLAYHAQQGAVWEQAVHHLHQAGVQAVTRSAHKEAVQWFERALEAVQHLPESRATQELAIDLRFDLRTALQPLGAFQRALDIFRTAEPLAVALHDPRRLAWIASAMTFYHRALGDHESAVASGLHTLALPTAHEDVPLQIETRLHLGTAYHGLGRYQQALKTFHEARVALERDPQPAFLGEVGIPAVLVRTYPLWSLAEMGAFAEGLALGESGLQIARAAASPYSLSMASCAVGFLHLRRGDFATAIAILEEALYLCQAQAVSAWIPGIMSHLGYAYALCGRVAESLPLLEQAITASQHLSGGHALWITWLGEALLLAHRVEAARDQAQRALTLAQQHQERGHLAWSLRLLGAIALQGDNTAGAQAEAYYRQALTSAEELTMAPLRAHCHMGLATLYRYLGQPEQSRAELHIATTLFRNHGMTFGPPQVKAQEAVDLSC